MRWHLAYWFWTAVDFLDGTKARDCWSHRRLIAKYRTDPEKRRRLAEARDRLFGGGGR